MTAPADRYREYFAEKLWELVPSTYRHEDGLAERPGVLRAIIELWADELARARRSHDRLWDDAFIDLADDWAVPYLGDLVGTRLVSALNPRGRRIDVAKTIYYRRRKGTVRVLEELVADVTGWEGKVSEAFRGLARSRHRLDPPPAAERGRFSGTGPGGWADLRDLRAAAFTEGPWDEYAHTADVRQLRGTRGRWNLPRLVVHLWRIGERRLDGVTPFALPGGQRFTFDPSGRDVPLLSTRGRADDHDWDQWVSARPWDVPAPIRCRVLGHAEYQLEAAVIAGLPVADPVKLELAPLVEVRFPSEARWRATLAELPSGAAFTSAPLYDLLRAGALVDECGKRALWPAALTATGPGGEVPRHRVTSGNLGLWSVGAPDHDLVIDPERGRLWFPHAPPALPLTVRYHDGLAGPIGAGSYDRRAAIVANPTVVVGGGGAIASLPTSGAVEVIDSRTYLGLPDRDDVTDLVLQAADRQRPYLVLDGDWTLTAAVGADAALVIDGWWLGARAPAAVVLAGAWRRVELRHATLDPGGVTAVPAPLPPVPLRVTGHVDELILDHAIAAHLELDPGASIDRLVCRDSILAATSPQPAIALAVGEVELVRATVLGAVDVGHLRASEALITGVVDVTDLQGGCFRFSAAPAGSRVPHPFEAVELIDSPGLFTSRVFGHPGFAQLGTAAPVALTRGAEDGSEIGAWASLRNPIKLDSLATKITEYLPFGLIPSFVTET